MAAFYTRYLPGSIPYTGAELRPHWIFEQTRKFGSALVAFRGPCEVATQELVDLEDRVEKSHIRAREMLHFLGEFFGESLELTVLRQRLFVAVFAETLRARLPADSAVNLIREGDDIYYVKAGDRLKMSVSIATASAVSTLLHFAVNIDPEGAPVAALGLQEFALDCEELAKAVLAAWKGEVESQEIARCKVIPR